MKKCKPIPQDEIAEWGDRLMGKSLDEIIQILGPAAAEYGPSEAKVRHADNSIEMIRYSRGLEFVDISPAIQAIRVVVREDGEICINLRGRELEEND